ncbi:MAG: hypothetical protein QF619_07190 [Candidatus Binatia bacterium]|nr:hypothetical protein [Candidatus Binatia bacterium]
MKTIEKARERNSPRARKMPARMNWSRMVGDWDLSNPCVRESPSEL